MLNNLLLFFFSKKFRCVSVVRLRSYVRPIRARVIGNAFHSFTAFRLLMIRVESFPPVSPHPDHRPECFFLSFYAITRQLLIIINRRYYCRPRVDRASYFQYTTCASQRAKRHRYIMQTRCTWLQLTTAAIARRYYYCVAGYLGITVQRWVTALCRDSKRNSWRNFNYREFWRRQQYVRCGIDSGG